MATLFSWIKDHKLTTVLLLIVFWTVLQSMSNGQNVVVQKMSSPGGSTVSVSRDMGATADIAMGEKMMAPSYAPLPPADTENRLVTTDTSLSLKVEDVAQSIQAIEGVAKEFGGYMIDSNLSKPEGAASGSISIRVPTDKRSEVLSGLRGLAVNVVSESVTGQDITDQFVDNEERLRILESTKSKFEAILDSATTVSQMLEVQREILSLQSQIDSIKGQQKYLEGAAQLSRISVYVSTDELALPYAPDNAWRPALVFKEAVRSLVMSLRSAGSLAIWALVYAPVVLVLGIIAWIIKKVLKR